MANQENIYTSNIIQTGKVMAMYLGIYRYMYTHTTHTHMHATTIKEKKGHEFKGEQGGGDIWEDLEGRKGRGR